jgi:hypothetical protein
MIRYETPADVALRLHKTICLYDTSPVLVTADPSLSEHLKVHIRHLDDDRIDIISANDDRLKTQALPLGYMNTPDPLYVVRNTYRQQLAGLPLQSLTVIHYSGRRDAFGQSLSALSACIRGQYPSFESIASNAVPRGAFHRRMAIAPVAGVPVFMYTGDGIGVYNRRENSVALLSRYRIPSIIRDVQPFVNIS